MFAYGPADTMHCRPQTISSLAAFKSRRISPFWYRLTPVFLEKRPLKGVVYCSNSIKYSFSRLYGYKFLVKWKMCVMDKYRPNVPLKHVGDRILKIGIAYTIIFR